MFAKCKNFAIFYLGKVSVQVTVTSKCNSRPLKNKCKPYFCNKHYKGDSDVLSIENDELLLKNKKVTDKFNSFSQSPTPLVYLNALYVLQMLKFTTIELYKNFVPIPVLRMSKEIQNY